LTTRICIFSISSQSSSPNIHPHFDSFDRRPAFSDNILNFESHLSSAIFAKMQFSLATIVLGLAAVASALPQGSKMVARQNQNRPVPNGTCCVAETNLKQDACTAANGQAGRCVPGGNNCKLTPTGLSAMGEQVLTDSPGGSRLSCVAQSNLTCDNNRQERGNTVCRANFPGGGFFDGANVIQDITQAVV
jgi:hypothetical protein